MASTIVRHAEDYTVGWIVALMSEFIAARKMLDHKHETPPMQDKFDDNLYTCGDIHGHNVVIVSLAQAEPGKVAAQQTVAHLPRAFPNMHIHMFVGIGGGIPRTLQSGSRKDIRLGDVVISLPERPGLPAVVEWDRGEQHRGYIEERSRLDKPGLRVRKAIQPILANHKLGESIYPQHLNRIINTEGFERPKRDVLYQSNYSHQGDPGTPCDSRCDRSWQVRRQRRNSSELVTVHCGTILSGDAVMTSANDRDRISHDHENALCFETEAAGIIDAIHPFIIRGISDYADSHKDDTWQKYAAATAAAFAREILYEIQPVKLDLRHEAAGGAALETLRLKSRQRLDGVRILLNERKKQNRKEDLEKARQELLDVQAELAQATIFDADYTVRVQWGLMVAERELGYYRHFSLEKNLNHFQQAIHHCKELGKMESLNSATILQIEVERCVLKGEKALVQYELGMDEGRTCNVKREAVHGIDAALKGLEATDKKMFYKVVQNATKKRALFKEPPY